MNARNHRAAVNDIDFRNHVKVGFSMTRITQRRKISWQRILCLFGRHLWVGTHHTAIDLWGNDDGVKVRCCVTCGKVHDDPHNMRQFNECIHEPESRAFQRIAKIGIAAYRKERIAEGIEIYG